MSGLEFAVLVIAGGVGSGLRYALDRRVGAKAPADAVPPGILVVNITGSFLLGALTGLGDVIDSAWVTIVGVGLLGGFTTFSTMAVDTARLAQRGRRDRAWLNLLGTFAACVVAAALGLALAGLMPS
ncbi:MULTISPECIES: fluoride efflux transporter CrcB [unclassified Microbacterium]|uniref:fluoride efflux transporter CrcB n=1 Tax=unclassified Microbacterium TaxID=2609290 RepID=UPI003864729E